MVEEQQLLQLSRSSRAASPTGARSRDGWWQQRSAHGQDLKSSGGHQHLAQSKDDLKNKLTPRRPSPSSTQLRVRYGTVLAFVESPSNAQQQQHTPERLSRAREQRTSPSQLRRQDLTASPRSSPHDFNRTSPKSTPNERGRSATLVPTWRHRQDHATTASGTSKTASGTDSFSARPTPAEQQRRHLPFPIGDRSDSAPARSSHHPHSNLEASGHLHQISHQTCHRRALGESAGNG
ncbi:hypothetical protein CF326_g7496 [Tilletia indica]|nr:hypothetical protein CF326_g7496 [Tilletia indica]